MINETMQQFGLMVWPANKRWAAQSGEEGLSHSVGDTPEDAVRNWLREHVVEWMRAHNPPSDVLEAEIAEFEMSGHVPQRWRMD